MRPRDAEMRPDAGEGAEFAMTRLSVRRGAQRHQQDRVAGVAVQKYFDRWMALEEARRKIQVIEDDPSPGHVKLRIGVDRRLVAAIRIKQCQRPVQRSNIGAVIGQKLLGRREELDSSVGLRGFLLDIAGVDQALDHGVDATRRRELKPCHVFGDSACRRPALPVVLPIGRIKTYQEPADEQPRLLDNHPVERLVAEQPQHVVDMQAPRRRKVRMRQDVGRGQRASITGSVSIPFCHRRHRNHPKSG